ncbi:MAG: L-threonylcarbamoyladenylate synthase [Oscillospiraceae bacterium]|nr:L-threonylcarbamoyladenylate synthase [Oscillospiraceae bacterium]
MCNADLQFEGKSTALLDAFSPEKHADNLRLGGEILRRGGLVVFPTETVYGLGADALNAQAVANIFRAKGRPADNPLIVHIASIEEITPLVRDFSAIAHKLADAFWPGPFTMVLPKSAAVPAITCAGLDTVAVRIPSHPAARALIRMAGVPVAAPSANISGRPSPTSARHCMEDMAGKAELVLDGGQCDVGIESTVLSLAGENPRLLRPGAVTAAMIRDVIGEIEADPAVSGQAQQNRAAISPGMKYTHYAPDARITIVHGGDEAFYNYAQKQGSDFCLAFDEDKAQIKNLVSYGPREDAEAQAKQIFWALRELDAHGAQNVAARPPKLEGLGLAVYNRLVRAAGFREVYL